MPQKENSQTPGGQNTDLCRLHWSQEVVQIDEGFKVIKVAEFFGDDGRIIHVRAHPRGLTKAPLDF
jgi:hypothetical protein